MKRLLGLGSSFVLVLLPWLPAEAGTAPLETQHSPYNHEVATKLLFDWGDAGCEGRVFQLTFSVELVPSEVKIALISQAVVCTGDSTLFPKRSAHRPFTGPLLARVISDLAGFDSTAAKNSFKFLMATADSMQSWGDPCIEGNIYLNFTSALQEGLQGDKRILYLVLYAPRKDIMTFSRRLPNVRLSMNNEVLKLEESASNKNLIDGRGSIEATLLEGAKAPCPKNVTPLDGFVYVQVTIEANGKVSRAHISKTDLPAAYQTSALEAALRTAWKPARNTKGLAVQSEVTLPFSFSCSTSPK